MITFTLTVSGVERTLARLDQLEQRLTDFRPLWPEMIALYQDVTNRAFDTEGSSTQSGAWAPLKPSTIRARELGGFGAGPILQRTQVLRRAVTEPAVDSTPTRLTLRVESNIYPYHQSTQPRTKLPRRAPVNFTSTDRARFREVLRLYVERSIAATGAGGAA